MNNNDNNSRLNKNHGTLEPYLTDSEIVSTMSPETQCDYANNMHIQYISDKSTPPTYLNEAPEIDYSNCYIPDDNESHYDDLTASCGIEPPPLAPVTNHSHHVYDEQEIHHAYDEQKEIERSYKENKESGAYKAFIKTKEYKVALGAGKRYLRKKAAGKEKAYFNINQRYVLASLCVCVDLGIMSIKMKADMKAGKTYAVGWLLANHPDVNSVLMVTALSALTGSAVDSAEKNHGIDGCVYDVMEDGDKHKLITTTFNSGHKVIEKRGSASFDLVLIDEAEQCATYMAKGTINNKYQAAVAMKQVSKASKFVVLADAHIGRNTHLFASRYFSDREFTPVFNNFKPWSGWTYSATGSYDAGISELHRLLTKNKKVFTVFTSSSLAMQTARMLKNEGITSRIKTITVCKQTKKDDEVQKTLSRAENFKLYEVCFVSPVAGAGVSIEGEHFHQTLAFISRDTKTPNSKSALQILFRVRDLIDKHITIVCIDNPIIGDKLEAFESIDADTEMLIKMREFINNSAMNGDKEAIAISSNASKSQALYEADISKSEIADYHKFWDNFFSELEKKGMIEVELDERIAPIDTKEARKEARDEITDDEKNEFVNAKHLDDDEFKKLSLKDKHASNEMTNDESKSLEKARAVRDFIPANQLQPNGAPTKEQSEKAFVLRGDGIKSKMNAIYCSQVTAIEAKKLEKAYINGIGFFKDHLLDIFDNRPLVLTAERKIYTALAKIIGLKCDSDGVYSITESEIDYSTCISEKGKRNQINVLLKAIPEFNATHDNKLSVMKLGTETLSYVIKLLKNSFGLNIKKTYKKDAYTIQEQQPILDIINSKRGDSTNKYENQLESINKSIARECDRESFEKAKKDVKGIISAKKLGLKRLDPRTEDHIISHTMKIPTDFRKAVIEEYIDIANNPRKKSKYFKPIALANLWLIDEAERYELSAKKH